MTIIDANLLVYAYNAQSARHEAAAQWLAATLNGSELVGLGPNPASIQEVFSDIRALLSQPIVTVPHPGPRHAEVLERLTTDHQVAGSAITDAVLAALAIENGAVLASTDQDFRRYPSLRWINPLAAETPK